MSDYQINTIFSDLIWQQFMIFGIKKNKHFSIKFVSYLKATSS
jgi:hypothetical protein